jgi:L-lactate dehydrogenase complex protein LldF
MDDWKHLSYASSLCGNCTEVCAVKINLHELLLDNRNEAVKQNSSSFVERMAWKFWKKAMLKRSTMNFGSARLKNYMINTFVPGWKKHRGELNFPGKTFNQLWQDKNKKRI